VRPLSQLAATACLVAAIPLAALAQSGSAAAADTAPASGWVRVLATLGSRGEERLRDAQLRGDAPAEGYLLRSASSLTPWESRPGIRLLAPELRASWNSRLPYSFNDGAMWAGKGASTLLMAGLVAQAGPLRLIAAPELAWSENRDFHELQPPRWDTIQPGSFRPPWLVGRNAADLPFRFGPGSSTRILPGQSSLTLRAGALELGAGSETQDWGPGIQSALLFSNQAAGFLHFFARSARPLRTPLGSLEARWLAGALEASEWAAVPREQGWRSLSAAALVLAPAGTHGLSLGMGRSVYAPATGRGDALGGAASVFTRWRREGDTLRGRPYEQMVSLFGRWVFPAEGAEVYAEWGRYRLPVGLRDLLQRPEHTQGYLLGAQWLRPAGSGEVRLQAEATFLERSPTWASRRNASWYASAAVPEGYTQQGQPLGSAVGPGGSGQWLGADWLRRDTRVGVFLGRIRWANDAYYDQLTIILRRYRGHEVSALGGLRAALPLGPLSLDARWTVQQHYNVFFQNTSLSFDDRDAAHEVDVVNHTLELKLSARAPALR
jgi:hypothetical protein